MTNPTFVPLLNSIAVNEAKGQRLFETWAAATPDKQLQSVLEFVAIREGEHAMAFTKRMCELGCEVDEESAYQFFKDFDGLLACAASDASDAEKVAMLTGGDGAEGEGRDPFRGFFNDTSIDPHTGALLGRYIAEERDSARRLKAEYDRVCGAAASGPAGSRDIGDSEFAELRACIAELREDMAKLRKKVKKLA